MNWEKSKSLTEERVWMAERKMGFKFSPKYRKFITDVNGGVPDRSVLAEMGDADTQLRGFYSIEASFELNDLEKNLKRLQHRMPKEFFAIADDFFGNFLAMSKRNEAEEIYFIDHEKEPNSLPVLVAKNIDDLLQRLLKG